MNERRVRLSNRVISLLLALVMVIGMIPAGIFSFTADAAATTTQTNVTTLAGKVNDFIEDNLEQVKLTDDKPTWDTEGKSYNWLYYNGMMLDAFLMNGAGKSHSVDALEIAANFYNENIKDENGKVYLTRFGDDNKENNLLLKGELDSIAPARALFDLLGTTKDQEKYHEMIQIIYNALMTESSYAIVSNSGGNYKHKQSGWDSYPVAMDGIYMAQPFFMECAKAIRAGKLTLKDGSGNAISADSIEAAVYERMNWIGNNMKFTSTDGKNATLYHHGVNVSGDTVNGNGVVWARGAGWYAAALIDVIEMTNDTGRRNALVAHLKTFMDGMLQYQQSSGLWYNVVYPAYTSESGYENRLETSGTALIAYALMKGYDIGVLDSAYGQKGLDAFNGIVNTKIDSNGKIKDIYKTAGVSNTSNVKNYCKLKDDNKKDLYVTNEGKGLAPLFMAMSYALDVESKLAGGSGVDETFEIGDVSVTELPVIGDQVAANGLVATVVGSEGTVKDVTELTATLDGNKVKVLYNGTVIDVVDAKIISTDAETGTGSFGIESGAAEIPAAPSFSAGNFVLIHEAIDGGNAGDEIYKLATKITSDEEYIIVAVPDAAKPTAGVALQNKDTGSGDNANAAAQSVTISADKQTITIANNLNLVKWTITSDGDGKYLVKNNGRWLRGNQNSNILTNSSSDSTRSIPINQINAATGEYQLVMNDGSTTRDLIYNGSNWTREGSANNVPKTLYLYEVTTSGGEDIPAVYAKLTGSQGLVYVDGTSDTTIVNAIKASDSFKVLVADNAAGTDAAEVAMSEQLVSVEKSSNFNSTQPGTYNFVVKYDGVEIGTIPVQIYNDTVTVDYTVTLTITPGAISGKVGETGSFTPTVVITDANGADVTSQFVNNIGYSGTVANTDIASVDEFGVITFNAVGNTTFTQYAEVNGTRVSATGDIVVLPDEAQHIHSYTHSETVTQAPTCTANGSKTVYCSCGASEVRTISATGHSWNAGEVTENATCNAAGTKTFTCTVCNTTKTETIAATGAHTYGDDNVCDVCQATKPATNVTVTTGTTPSETEFVVATQMSEDLLYVIANGESGNDNRALYWGGNSWGASENTLTGPENDKYTLASDKNVTLWKWDSTGENTGYFYFVDNGTTYYLYQNTVSSESKTEYTVELGSAPRIYNGSNYLKVEKDSNGNLSFKSGNSGSATHLLTPVMTGTDGESVDYLVEASGQDLTVEAGKTVDPVVTLTGKDAEGNPVTVTGTWEFTSADNAIATVENGKIKGVAEGNATITATLKTVAVNGHTGEIHEGAAITATFTVSVTPAPAGKTYTLLTGGIDTSKQYLIVYRDGDNWYLLQDAESAQSSVASDVAGYRIDKPSDVSTIILPTDTDDSRLLWTFGAASGAASIKGKFNRVDLTSSGNALKNSEFTAYVRILDEAGGITIAKNSSSGDYLHCTKGEWGRASGAQTLYLYAPGTSSGGGTTPNPENPPVPASQYVHDFTANGKNSDFYTISGNLATGKGTVDYDGKTLTQALKMESSTNISFTAPADGKLTLVFVEETPNIKIDGKKVTGSKGIITIDLTAGSHTITKADTMNLFYMVYTPEGDSLSISGQQHLQIGGTDRTELTFAVRYDGQNLTDGYELLVESSNTDAVQIEQEDGKFYAVAKDGGVATITAKLVKVGQTDVSGKNIQATLDVDVAEPTITVDEEKTVYLDDRAVTIYPYVAYGENAVTKFTVTASTPDGTKVTATANDDGSVTLVGLSATAEGETVDVTITLTSVNGNTIPEGLTYSDITKVEVVPVKITKMTLVPNVITRSTEDTLADVTSDENQIQLVIDFNNGDVQIVDAERLKFDNSAIKQSDGKLVAGNYTVPVSYDDATLGVEYRNSITVAVLSADLIGAEGIASDVKVEYELDTDGTIQDGDKYIIVVNGKALMVAEGANDDNTGALNGNLTVSQDGKIITVSALADHTEFLFSGRKTSNSNQTYSQVYATANGKNFSLYNNSSNVLDTGSNSTITLFAVDEDAGEYKIGLRSDDYYLVLNDSSWGRTSDATKATVVKLYKRTETATNSKTVGFEIRGDNVGACENNVHAVINPVGVGLSMDVIPSVTLGGQKIEDLSGCVIEWSVEENGKDYIKVENGKITGLKVTDKAYKVYARLVSVDGKKIIENESNNAYLQEIIEVTVQQDTLRYDIFIDGVQKETMKLPLGVKPDLNRVEVRVYSQLNAAYVETYQYSDLIFKVADSTLDVNKPNSSATIEIQNKSTETKIGDLKVEVGASVTDNRDTATEFPGYPDEGAVRFNKFATGIDFLQTAIAKIELNVAGISTNAPVDVILIVDVSNSMGWSILKSSKSDDHLQIPDKVEGSDDLYKDDKLDNAMDSATTFADILLRNNMAGDKENNNTITFVTFAGNDINKPGAKTGSVDATQTVFVGVDNFTDAQKSFDNTEFTNYRVYTETDKNDKEVTKVEYSLKISGINGQPTVQTINGTQYTSSGKNEGGTNYDYGFLEAQAAARALKNEVAGSEEDYDKSNRKLVVVFMTDGAASHYNGWCNGTSSQIDGFTKRGTNDDPWIDMLKKPSNNATALYAMVSEMYTIGFDLKNGGLADEATAKRILSGLVENQKLDCKLAENDTELQAFFEDLANSLAFAGTAANVADVVSTDFVLWTETFTYGEGANQKTITPDIQVVSRRLVVRGDVGTTLHVAEKQGEAGVKVTLSATNIESYLGYYVLGTYESADAAEYTSVEVEILETVTFASGEVAYSSVKGVSDNIWEGGKITASNFVYDVDKKTFSWTIGNISDREVALVYYGYLTGTYNRLGNDGTAREDGQYPTNKEASLSYIDVNGDLATRMYPVPHMTWGEAAVTVRFYLVDADGKFINRAGHTFDSPANRIFLENRAYYDYPLGDAKTVNAAQALQEAKFVESYTLYDPDANITVSNKDKTIAWTHSENVQKQLEYYIDNSGGNFTNVIIDIPVIMTDLGESDQKMSDSIVVIDYSNSVQWDVRGDAEKQYDGVEFGGVKYSIELVGFATYNPNVDLKDYIFETTWATTIDATYGTFSIGEGEDQVIYTPNKMLGGADHVFAVFKFENLQAGQTETEDFYYMYKHIIVVPATVVHYETTGNMGGAFTSTDKDEKAWSVAESKDDGNAVVGAVTKYQSSANSGYGYDESYTGCIAFSGGSALSIENTDRTATKPSVKFTFTGTGIDIIGATNPDQGLIRMTITAKGAEDPVKTVVVLNKGVDTLYQIPVLSVEGLPYDTYEAEIIVYAKTTTYGGTFYFDAINVYGSAREADVVGSNTAGNITVESLYKAAGEYAPQIVEIRDILLGNNSFGNVTASGVNGAAVYIDGGSTLGEGSTNFNDYDKIGPNNEVYLSQNQAIAFKIKATDGNLPKTLAIGLKALNAEADVSIIVVDANNKQYNYSYTVATSTAMFYDLLGGDKLTDFTTGANGLTIVIANKDTDKVTFSVTDLKVGYGDNKGKITTVVDSDIADQATAALKASADVVSVTCNGNAYAMYTTTLEVVTGQAATSIQVTDGNQTIDATATFVDTIDGYRQWRVLIRLPEVGDKTLTVTGLDSNGAASTVTGNIELQVALFEGATKTTD